MRVLTDPIEIRTARAKQLRRLRRQARAECVRFAHRFAKGARAALVQFTVACGFLAIWMASLAIMTMSLMWLLEHCTVNW